MRDETLLAFLEGNNIVKVYSYRGIEGFKQVTSFALTKPSFGLKSIKISTSKTLLKQCDLHFLSVISGNDVTFYKAVTEPEEKCIFKANLNCE